MIYKTISRFPNYVRAFGVFRGLALLLSLEKKLPKQSSDIREYRVPGVRSPIFLRKCLGDHATFFQCMTIKQYDLTSFKHYEKLQRKYEQNTKLGKKTVIVDCGANIGLGAIWFAENFPNAVVVAIEPEHRNFELLRKNTAVYGDSVIALQGAIWPNPAKLLISNPEAGPASFEVKEVDISCNEAIRGYCMSEILELTDSQEIFIAKIDIEGSQKQLFARSTEWVGKTHLVILELEDWKYPWEGTSRPFFGCVSQYPFEYQMKGENIFCFQDLYH